MLDDLLLYLLMHWQLLFVVQLFVLHFDYYYYCCCYYYYYLDLSYLNYYYLIVIAMLDYVYLDYFYYMMDVVVVQEQQPLKEHADNHLFYYLLMEHLVSYMMVDNLDMVLMNVMDNVDALYLMNNQVVNYLNLIHSLLDLYLVDILVDNLDMYYMDNQDMMDLLLQDALNN